MGDRVLTGHKTTGPRLCPNCIGLSILHGSGELSFSMETNGCSGRTTNGTVLRAGHFSDEDAITSSVVLFSRFYRNDRDITEPIASSHSRTMLLDEIRGLFPKITSGKKPFYWIPQRSAQLSGRASELVIGRS